jgi:hypothetical protein
MNVEIGIQNIIILFWKYCNEAVQFHFWEYINQNQALILDFHWPFFSRVYVLGLRTDVERGSVGSELI